jgi:hypothetical protein
MKLILETNRGGIMNPVVVNPVSPQVSADRQPPTRAQAFKGIAFNTVQTAMLALACLCLFQGGEALAFSAAIQGVGVEICNVYKAIKQYVAPGIAVLMFGIAFVELKTGNRGAQGRAMAAFMGALFFANIGAIVTITKLPINSCQA